MRLSKKCLCKLFSVPLFLATVLCLSQEFSVGALDYVVYDNTGGVSESPYGKAQIPCEYSDIDYYDCYLPFGKRVSEFTSIDNDILANNFIGEKIGYAGNDIDLEGYSFEPDTGCAYVTSASGVQYYLVSMPEFEFNMDSSFDNNFSEGVLTNLYLEDGTVIHAAVISEFENTNDDYAVSSYNKLVDKSSGDFIKFYGKSEDCINKIAVKYSLTSYSLNMSTTRVSYVRVFNADLSTELSVTYDNCKNLSFILNVKADTQSNESNIEDGAKSESGFISGHYSDKSLDELSGLGVLNDYDLAKVLADEDINSVNVATSTEDEDYENVSSKVVQDKKPLWKVLLKVVIILVGTLTLLYSILVIIGYFIDRNNEDFDFIGRLTFGKYAVYDDGLSGVLEFKSRHLVTLAGVSFITSLAFYILSAIL